MTTTKSDKGNSRADGADGNTQPKRRARGLKRQHEILTAAERVFAEVGYQDANTNLIAEQANCSPGTLYQFFKNKEQIAETIANEYARDLQAIQQAITEPSRYKTIEDAIDEIIKANLKFLRTAPAFGVLLHATHLGSPVRGAGPVLAHTVAERIAAILKRHGHALSDADAYFHAEVCVRVFGGMLPLLQHADARVRRRAANELKELAKRYLGPIVHGR
jgi:AcrR family transcriptional regulator